MSRRSCSDATRGFTLIEALVALAIIAAVLSSIGAVIGVTVKGTRAIDQRLALTGAAETVFAALPDRNALKPGRQSGELAGHRWRIDVAPMNDKIEAKRNSGCADFRSSIQLVLVRTSASDFISKIRVVRLKT